jgi:hypothetical protein
MCDNYPQIADPADPSYKEECDPATVAVLGDYIGAQMAGFNVDAVLGLIDHVQEGDVDQPYTPRTVVVGGNSPYVTTVSAGALPAGLMLDSATGVLSGTPMVSGSFSFTVSATDADAVQVTRDYLLTIHGIPGADECPDDPTKTEPGFCGCGIAETDGDGDGAPNCIDECVADPAKTAPGACGCGIADADSNSNGVADCLEPQADVGIAISASRSMALVGKRVSFKLSLTNAGPALAGGVVATATVSGAPFEIVKMSKGCVPAGDQIVCALGDLAAGKQKRKKVTVRPLGAGTLTGSGAISSTTADSNLANQAASVEALVILAP